MKAILMPIANAKATICRNNMKREFENCANESLPIQKKLPTPNVTIADL